MRELGEESMSKPWESEYGGEKLDAVTGAAPNVGPGKFKPWHKEYINEDTWRDGRAVEGRITTPSPKKESVPNPEFERIFARLIEKESAGRHFVDGELLKSPKGARGVTQVMPKTGKDPGYGVKPLQNKSREEFIRFGRDYLKAMLREFDNDYEKALAAYNAGPGNVKRAIRRGGDNWKDHLPKRSETLPYIKFILGDGSG